MSSPSTCFPTFRLRDEAINALAVGELDLALGQRQDNALDAERALTNSSGAHALRHLEGGRGIDASGRSPIPPNTCRSC